MAKRKGTTPWSEIKARARAKGKGEDWWGSTRGQDRSLSSWWGSRVGGFRSWFSDGESQRPGRLIDALGATRRIGRIVFGKEVEFRWYDDHSGENETLVTLDPTPLDSPIKDWSDGERVDAVVGDALQRAGYLRHAEPDRPDLSKLTIKARELIREAGRFDELSLTGRPGRQAAVVGALVGAGTSFFEAAGNLYGVRRIVDEFPGYEGYLDRRREYAHRDGVRKIMVAMVNEHIEKDPRHLAAAVVDTLWLTLAPDKPLAALVPTAMREVTQEIANQLRAAGETAESGGDLAVAAVAAMERLAQFVLTDEEGQSAASPWEDSHTEDAIADARAMLGIDHHGAGRRRLDSSEAATIDELVAEGFARDESENEFYSVGKLTGAVHVPVHTIKARPDRAAYRASLERVRPLVARTRAALTFRNEQASMDELGLRRGAVDEGAIHKLVFGETRIFARREIEEAPQVHLGVLVDESGSMSARVVSGLTRAVLARDSAILLAEAVRGIRGVRLSVWGHTANTYSARDGTLVRRYLGPGLPGGGNIETLGSITADTENADGWALAYAAKEMLATSHDGESKILLVLADGIPAAWGKDDSYHGPKAMDHVAAVARLARRRGVQVFCLGMGEDLSEADLESQYDAGNYALVADASHLPEAVSRILTKALRIGAVR